METDFQVTLVFQVTAGTSTLTDHKHNGNFCFYSEQTQ